MNLRKPLRLIAGVVPVLAVAAVVLPAGSAAARSTPKRNPVHVVRLSACRGHVEVELGMFTHRLGCRQALRLMSSAVNDDRRCPRGWIVHAHVRPPKIDPVSSRYPPLTLCSRTIRGTVRAFAYVLPGG
jgi:hypothetical protein